MREIKLTNCDKYFLVSDEDYEEVNAYSWRLDGNYPARTINPKEGRIRRTQRLHELLIPYVPKGMVRDHRDRNGLNNQRNNLRVITYIQNAVNKKKQSNNTSGYTGITWHKGAKKWMVSIWVNRKHIYLGLYDDIEKARQKRERAVRRYFSGIKDVEM